MAGNIDEALGGGSPLRSLLSGGISATKGKITGGGKKQTVPAPDAPDVKKAVSNIDAPDISSGKYSLYGEIAEGDGKAYERFLKDGPQEGLTEAEIIGIYKADKQAALNAISQNEVLGKGIEGGSTSPKGVIGHDFEDYLTKNIGGDGSFNVGGRDFDGGIGNRWWEAKSGGYWEMLESNPNKLAKFKSDMGDRLRIATENGATYELFSNTPIPDSIKQWLDKKGIAYTELLD